MCSSDLIVDPAGPEFMKLAILSRALATGAEPAEQRPEYAELQARIARLFELTEQDFAHILETFPLIPREVRSASLARFIDLP